MWKIGTSLLALSLACLANPVPVGAETVPAAAAAPEKEPLVIAKQGNFYVGDRVIMTPTGPMPVDTMFVEFQIPAELKHPYPMVFIHGGGSTGVGYWSTPDGREGWATLFLRKGYAVYVVDLPTSGRSPHYAPYDGPMVQPTAESIEPRLTRPQDYLLWPQARHFSRFPGTGKVGDPDYEQLRKRRHQPTVEHPTQDGAEGVRIKGQGDVRDREAGAALLDRIGPAILVTHSRGGPAGWNIADARPGLVKGIVALEPNGPPFFNQGSKGEEIAPRPWGLTYAQITYSPPAERVEDFGKLSQLPAEGPELEGCWVPSGPKRTLPHLARLPVMVIAGQASYHAAYDHCTTNYLQAAGVAAELFRLEEHGITGNGHLLLVETNNHEIADLAAKWLADKGL